MGAFRLLHVGEPSYKGFEEISFLEIMKKKMIEWFKTNLSSVMLKHRNSVSRDEAEKKIVKVHARKRFSFEFVKKW